MVSQHKLSLVVHRRPQLLPNAAKQFIALAGSQFIGHKVDQGARAGLKYVRQNLGIRLQRDLVARQGNIVGRFKLRVTDHVPH